MRRVPFQSVLIGTAKMLGLVAERDLTPARAASLTEYINNRVKEGWEFDFWPEWTRREERQYRPPWDGNAVYDTTAGRPVEVNYAAVGGLQYVQALQPSGGALGPQVPFDGNGNINAPYWALSAGDYTAQPYQPGRTYFGGGWGEPGDQVWDPSSLKFLQCYVTHIAGPSIDYTKFAVLTPFDRYVGFHQPGQTPLGRVRAVYLRDPMVATRNPGQIPFKLSGRGVQVNFRAPASVWVEFADREPQFTSCFWSGTVSYLGQGELVYFPPCLGGDGNCYRSKLASLGDQPAPDSQFWELQAFPLVLSNFVKRAALADALRDLKQTDRASFEEQRAYDELASAQEREIQAQGGSETVQALTYGGGY